MCQCYGHADECFYNESINEGQCICNNYTDGIMCDDCVAGFYRGSAMMFTEACIGTASSLRAMYMYHKIFLCMQIVVASYLGCPIL